jgi:transglycosylase-like protein with SLT domain
MVRLLSTKSPFVKHVLMVLSASALAFAAGGTAHAKIWGYIDETGKVHVSTSKVDDRYQIFFKGRTALEAADTADRTQSHMASRLRGGTRQARAARFDSLIEQHAASQRLDPALVKAVIAAESSFEPNAVSLKGAVGLMQITPNTAERYGVVGDATRSIEHKLRDPAINQ